MAMDLLQPNPTKHLYRHDLESLFYVIVMLTTGYDEGKKVKNPPLASWFELDNCWLKGAYFCLSGMRCQPLPQNSWGSKSGYFICVLCF